MAGRWSSEKRKQQAEKLRRYKEENPYFEVFRLAAIRDSPFRKAAGERLKKFRENPEIEKKRATNSGIARRGITRNGWRIPEEHREFYIFLLRSKKMRPEEAQKIIEDIQKKKNPRA
jgi:hypothetical protein